MTTINDQTLSLDDVEPENSYVNCHMTVSNELIRINDVVFDHCQFDQTNFDRGDWGYVTFKDVNLLNTTFHESYFANCQFINSQLMGADFSIGTRIKNSRMEDSNLQYANFSETKIENSRFVNSNLNETSFQAVTVKKALEFDGSQINEIDFLDTKLKGVDLSKAKFETLIITPENIKGLKINVWQAGQLMAMLGVVVS